MSYLDNLPKQNYHLKPYLNMLRGEQKAYFMRHSDIANLNFKILIDYSKPYGLLASEEETNSALSYLKRIGEDTRYEMLKVWIENLKTLIIDYEFLFLTVDGLDAIQNMKMGHFPTQESRLNFNMRDTVDLRVHSIISTYKSIVFDTERGVEVLPINLRRFDLSVVVYVAGYFNMMLYDPLGYDSEDMERLIFPTIKKLSDAEFNYQKLDQFNNVIYDITDAEILIEESGKSFITEVSNETLEVARNNITLGYRFCSFNGNFNNTFGHSNYANLLAVMSDLHKNNDISSGDNASVFNKFKDNISTRVKNKFKELSNTKSYTDAGRRILKDTISLGEQKLSNMEQMLFSKVTVTGDIWDKMSVEYGRQMVQNTVNIAVNKVEDRLVRDPLTKLNNVLITNFKSNIYDMFSSNNNSRNGIEIISNNTQNNAQNNTPNTNQIGNGNVGNKVVITNENVYKRNGF